jgi:phosphatidyl-myo-inositol alpha-mannosyltransferase
VRAASESYTHAGRALDSERPSANGASENPPPRRRRGALARGGLLLAGLLVAGLVAFALSRLGLHNIGHALITASPGWVVLALVLMGSSLFLRAISWQQVLRAALPETPIPRVPVIRATMIGVMASALFPGRVGEPTRVLVLTRRLDGRTRRLIPVVAGTVVSQTLINLLALGALAVVTFTAVPLLHGHTAGLAAALAVPLAVCALVIAGPRLLALGSRSRSPRARRIAAAGARMLDLARQGLLVFARPRHAVGAVGAQLLAWTLQWLACYSVVLALGLQSHASPATAAAILLAVNLSAILPATPSNVGVFQAACLVVLAAYGVGAGPALAYGIILQAVEVITALALGIPALLGEGLTWREIRSGRADRGPEDGPEEIAELAGERS